MAAKTTQACLNVQESVKQYYGKDLQSQADLQSGINCHMRASTLASHVKKAFAMVHDDVTAKYFGCGPVVPEALDACHVLDLGSGSGRDCFAVSKLIGSTGHVVGIDMTEEQLDIARNYTEYHREKFGYDKGNVDFRFGYIEKLGDAGIKDTTFDVIISNCVLCLCPDKRAVLEEAHRVLKDGGEMYFGNIYSNGDVSEEVKQDHIMWGEGVGGAQKWEDFYSMASDVGFSRPRVITCNMVNTSKFDDKLDGTKFVSVTYRLFKLPKDLHPVSSATYLGGIEGCPDSFKLDHTTVFKTDETVTVDAELATVFASSRFGQFFHLEAAPDGTPAVPDPKVDPVKLAEGRPTVQKSCEAKSK